jgi:ParB/RepB/Spo0J family partition protein
MKLRLDLIRFAEDESGDLLNPRGRITDTTDLQESMGIAGQQDAICIYEADGYYIVVDGHRRVTAARALGWQTIDAVIQQRDDENLLAKMLASNVRRDFKPTALGRAIKKLTLDNRWPIERTAKLCGLKIDVAMLYVDLTCAPDPVQRRVDAGEMSITAFKALRDKPREIQEKAASLPKPTVQAVKQTIKQDSSAGILTDLLDKMEAENTLAADLNILRTRLMAQWHTFGTAEKTRVQAIVDNIHQFITEANYAVTDVA